MKVEEVSFQIKKNILYQKTLLKSFKNDAFQEEGKSGH